MGTFDDLDDMAPDHLDAAMAEWLISGAFEIDDAPPGFDRVVALINKVQGPATASELAARVPTVTAFAARARHCPVVRAQTKRPFAFPKFPAKVLAVFAPIFLLGGGVAAATGSLPPSAQAVVSKALSSLGISVPNPQNDSLGVVPSPHSNTGDAPAQSARPDAGPGTAPTGPGDAATWGLCAAWKAGGLYHDSTAYRSLASSAGGAGNLSTYCASVSASAAPVGTTVPAKKPSTGRLHGGHIATTGWKASARRGAAHRARVAPGRPAASATTAPPPTPWRAGTSQAALGSSGRTSATAGPLVPRGTDEAKTAMAPARGNGSNADVGQGVPPASTSPTLGISAPTATVYASSGTPTRHGPSRHHGQRWGPRRPHACPGSAPPGHGVQAPSHCQRVTPTGSRGMAPSTGSARHVSRGAQHVLSMVTPRHS
jgi:hypothetical protein